jgi:hypothetical protein
MTVSANGGSSGGTTHSHRWRLGPDFPVTDWAGPAVLLRELPRETIGLAAVALLGLGASLSDGFYSVAGLLLLVLGIVAVLLIRSGNAAQSSGLVWSATVSAGAMATAFLYGGSPLLWLSVAVGGGAAVIVVLCPRRPLRAAAAAVSAVVWLMLLILNVDWGGVPIDVVLLVRGGTSQLLQGVNPYAASYASSTPGLASSHFPYGPGVLLLSVPGRLLGDVRLSDLLAVLVLVAAVVVLARRRGGSEQGWRFLALCLTLPFLPHMISLGFAELYLVAAIAVWLCWTDSHPWAATLVLGVGLSTLPTALALLAVAFIWWPKSRRQILLAIAVALAICAPFVFWAGPDRFISDTVGLQLRLPPRVTGLDLDSGWVRLTHTWFPGWVWPLLTLAALGWLIRTQERTWSMALFLGAGWLGVSLLFAKWAYFDYYFVVVIGVLLGLALRAREQPDPHPSQPGEGGELGIRQTAEAAAPLGI